MFSPTRGGLAAVWKGGDPNMGGGGSGIEIVDASFRSCRYTAGGM